MNNVIISYRDRENPRPERYEAGPYKASSVKQAQALLRLMGGTDFKFHPTNKPAIGDKR